MSTMTEQCVNYEINLEMCPCTSDSCERRGICCECIQAHYARGGKSACMRGAQRAPETMGLASRAVAICAQNQERNLEFCVCTWEPCGNKGVCCNCVRNHFTTDGTGRVACMR